jgi:hypothetical protein
LTPRTLPTGADEAGGPPLKVLRDLGQPLADVGHNERVGLMVRREPPPDSGLERELVQLDPRRAG